MIKKRFRLIDAILAVICVVFTAETAAPIATIGNSQYFWWFFYIIAFLLPYGMITAELGSTYNDEGGLYDWVRRAFGERWGARVAWYYWVNFPLWMASLAVIFPEVINVLTGEQLSTPVSVIIELVFIGSVTVLSFFRASDNKWVINISAFFKVFLALTVGTLGVYVALTKGAVTTFTLTSILPTIDVRSLSFVSVILFCCVGFEVVTSFAAEMENPKKQIPTAIIISGITIAMIYLFISFGISVAIPAEQISTSTGLIDSIQTLTGQQTGLFIDIAGILFLVTLFGNMVSWAYGINYVAQYASKHGNMPKIFSYESKKTGMPIGSSFMSGIVASALVLIAPILPSPDLFWSFFALNAVMLLLSYVPLFPAFLKLRSIDPDSPRLYEVSGGKIKLRMMAIVPTLLLIMAIIFTSVPLDLSPDELQTKIPLLTGTIVGIALGEIICRVCPKRVSKQTIVSSEK